MYKIFVSALAYDDGKSGISNYTDNVLRCLCEKHSVEVAVFKKDIPVFASRNPRVKILPVGNWASKPAISALWHLFGLVFTIDFSKYDFIFLPAGNRRLFSRCPKWTVTTFHDLSQFHLEGKYDKLRMFYIFNVLRRFLLKVDSICAISNSTSQDLQHFYKIPQERIFINYNGFDKARIADKSISRSQLEAKFSISGKYLLYVARIEHPGKNHLNLIKAYEQLPTDIKDQYSLVFAGSDWNGAETVKAYASASSEKDKIHFCGFVDDKYLSALFRHACLYVFPSFCEGFGIPMLEAFEAGVPVVCSNTTSLPEVGGEAVLTFDPKNVSEMSQIIVKVLTNSNLYDKLIHNGYERVKAFDWHKHSERIVDQYERMCDK